MKRIGVIGSLNVDMVGYVNHMPAAGETVLAEDFKVVPGGKGANQAFAIGRMGAQVSMFGMVGNDGNGLLELDNLREAGVDVSHVETANTHTGIALIHVDANGQNSIVVAQGANARVSKDYIDRKLEMLAACDIVVMQLEIPLETVLYSARILKSLGKTVILDPAPAPGPLPPELLTRLDYIKPNETELELLTGRKDPESGCRILLDSGVGCVLASRGAEGVLVAKSGQPVRHFPARRVKAVDTTAAGDSFTAAFAYALAENAPLEKTVNFAQAAAAIAVGRRGAQTSVPTSREVEQLRGSFF